MDHIFIDTSFFEAENFMQGKVLRELFELGHKGEIQIIINRIIYQELKSRIHKSLERAKLLINTIKKEGRAASLNESHRDLLNLKVAKEEIRIFDEMDDFLQHGKVLIIDYSEISIKEIFSNYFEIKPPFGAKENKKHEFPDAFSLAMLEKWLVENGKKGLTISKDNDIQHYPSKHLTPINDPAKYLDLKIRAIHERKKDRALALIEKFIDTNKPAILESIKDGLIDRIEQDINYTEFDGRNVEDVEHIEVEDLHINDFSVIRYEWNADLDEVKAAVELSTSYRFKADLGYENLDHAFWDSEDQKYYNVEYETVSVEQADINKVILELEFSIEDEKPKLFNFSIEEIDPIDLDTHDSE